jgi:hypothetical protein
VPDAGADPDDAVPLAHAHLDQGVADQGLGHQDIGERVNVGARDVRATGGASLGSARLSAGSLRPCRSIRRDDRLDDTDPTGALPRMKK